MTVSRRDVFAGVGLVSAVVAANTVAACSPADYSAGLDAPGKFFSLISQMRLVEAKKFLVEDSSLVIATTVGVQTFSGAKDIGEAVYRLVGVEGFSMIGDKDDVAAGGMYWREMGPWFCSDMLKGNAVEVGGCFDGLNSSVLNVLVNLADKSRIRSIVMLENMNLIPQWFDGGENSRNF